MARTSGTPLRARLVLPLVALAAILGTTVATLPAQAQASSGEPRPPSASSIELPDEVFSIAIEGDRAYVLGSWWTGGGWGYWQGSMLSIYALSGSKSPAFLGSAPVPNGFGAYRGFAVDRGFAYIPTSFEFLVLDVSDPAALRATGSLAWGPPYQPRCIAAGRGRAYVGDAIGLHVVDIGDPTSPSMLGSIALSSEPLSGALDGTIAYVGTSDGRLTVVDVSNSLAPAILATMTLPGTPWDLEVRGGRAYVSAGESGLLILDVSHPALPRILGGVSTPGDARHVSVSGARAYVVDRRAREWFPAGVPVTDLRVIDVSDPRRPEIVNSIAGVDHDEGNGFWATSQDQGVIARKGNVVIGGSILHVPLGDCIAVPGDCNRHSGYLSVTPRAACEPQSPCSDELAMMAPSPGTASTRVPDPTIPATFGLRGNDPNPFNPETSIRFDVPRASRVRIRIFDARGRLVRTLVDDALPPGRHEVTWWGRSERGEAAASGIYFVAMEAKSFRQTRKITLMK